jgi:outer membrane receptor protein involved in Fe transport
MSHHLFRPAPRTILTFFSAILLNVPGARAQAPDSGRALRIDPMTITATWVERNQFATSAAIGVIDSSQLRKQAANNPVDLFRSLPGVDVTGVGANQIRPVIRGQRGQRILLLQNGIRLNNARRQQDFGEIPALADLDGLQRIEVLRGPASVLYGTDAIGGVVNLITATPPRSPNRGLHGNLAYRFGSADDQVRPSGNVFARAGRFRFGLGASYRETQSYDAPAGDFGDLSLDRKTRVHDTGVTDQSFRIQAGYALGEFHDLLVEVERYDADNAGFGYVAAADYGRPDDPFIQILYPHQRVNRLSARYEARAIGLPFADRVSLTGYGYDNERDLVLNVFIPFGPGTPAGSGIAVNTKNFTDLGTRGFRAEAVKILGRHAVTYGMDYFRDRSRNTDVNQTTVVGFGPPQTQTDSTPQVPNATYRSLGGFIQGELSLAPRVLLTLGTRYQDVKAATEITDGISDPLLESTDRTVVGTANLLYRITDNLNLIGTAGRGFRSPNLVERFFQGPTPEGSGYQSRNPELTPETSVNVEVGFKYRVARLYLEGFAFRNTIYDGIRIEATGDSVGPFPEFRNVNVDKLRFTGFEILGDWNVVGGFSAALSLTHLRSKDVINPSNPVGETYADKLAAEARYETSDGRLALAYELRYQTAQKDIELGTSPIGAELPAFSVHSARASARLLTTGRFSHSLSIVVRNLTNRLYAESANASFFRPEPGRHVTLSWSTGF